MCNITLIKISEGVFDASDFVMDGGHVSKKRDVFERVRLNMIKLRYKIAGDSSDTLQK